MALGSTTRIICDGELSLAVTTGSGLIYGVIFHPDRRHCSHDGCNAVIGDDGTVRASGDAQVDDHTHRPSYPVGAPPPGEWSVHS